MGILTTLLQAITIKANGWSDGGHAINHMYDILFMMDQDHIPVGVRGEGGILPNGTILPNVGGFQPINDQGMSTAGGCRYRQAIPVGLRGRQDISSNLSLRKAFLPQGILVSPTGWATSDTVYDLLHMMGRDDIPVGLGDVFAVGQVHPTFPAIVDCKYAKLFLKAVAVFWTLIRFMDLLAICLVAPEGSLKYTAENSAKSGAPRDTRITLNLGGHQK
ncbi:hypothetical protein Q3G72_026774 [Acer saccharum]|nr:hypothetical protein Q3G72_026774 [Acer saccharum]